MAKIPVNNPVEKAIEGQIVESLLRHYIGYSGLAHSCNRYLWYTFRFAYTRKLSKKQVRLFARGDAEEPIIIADLKSAGMVVSDTQVEISDDTGHILGHIDGSVINVPGWKDIKMLLEAKTMNDANFKLYKKKGLKIGFPVYYGQINSYMGKMGFKKTLYVITNKNTDERKYDIYEFDESKFNDLESKGFGILISEEPPEKIGESTWFECKFCDARQICHKGLPVQENCRTCRYGTIENDGKWSCGNDNMEIDINRQRIGCDDYCKMECL